MGGAAEFGLTSPARTGVAGRSDAGLNPFDEPDECFV